MLLTYDESLRSAIENADNAAVVALLEPRVKEGIATEGERLLCGVLLLMPPLADYEAAAEIFGELRNGNREFQAAVWDAYRFAVLLPDGAREFEASLRSSPQSAVAAHMLSMVAAASNNGPMERVENRRSRALRPFPFNIIEALKWESGLQDSDRSELWRSACDLIVSRSAESDAPVYTVEGALQRRWDNLILGTRLTSQLWSKYSKIFEKL